MTQTAYEQAKDVFAKVKHLGDISGLLHNDEETRMASGSEDDRVEKYGAIAELSYMLLTDPKLSDLLDKAEEEQESLAALDKRNLMLMRQAWVRKNALSKELSRELAMLGGKGNLLHVKNYKSGDWSVMGPWYAHAFKITREVGQAWADKLGTSSAYEALLQKFSPGVKVTDVEREFAKLDSELRTLIPEALEYQKSLGDVIPATGQVAPDDYNTICRDLVDMLGFDLNRGRFDVIKGHPSQSGTRDDARLTTRLEGENGEDWVLSLYSIIHEAGHGIYEQGLPEGYKYQPVGAAYGLSIHESQSMIMERELCKTPEFFAYFSDLVAEKLGLGGHPAFTPQNIERYVNRVERGFIRVNADELTYPMHVVLRFELEKKIIDGDFDVERDLPDAWNAGMQEKLGITPSNHAQGCMQDVHWPVGLQGYFPAYAMGAILASQLFSAAERDISSLRGDIRKGQISAFNTWCRTRIHEKGSSLDMNDLIQQATGETMNSDYFLTSMKRRYLGRALAA